MKNNFKSSYGDLNCPLCSDNNPKHLDDQHHLLHCIKLGGSGQATADGSCCGYKDIFGDNVEKMAVIIDLLDKAMETRQTQLDEQEQGSRSQTSPSDG